MKRQSNRDNTILINSDQDPLRLHNFLCFAMYSANLAVSRVYRPVLAPLGITYIQYLVLVVLWESDGQTVGELGERLFLESSTLTPVIKRLETIGYVKRARDPDDERQVRVLLTTTGKSLQRRACDIPHTLLTATGLSTRDVKALQDSMLALRERLLTLPIDPHSPAVTATTVRKPAVNAKPKQPSKPAATRKRG